MLAEKRWVAFVSANCHIVEIWRLVHLCRNEEELNVVSSWCHSKAERIDVLSHSLLAGVIAVASGYRFRCASVRARSIRHKSNIEVLPWVEVVCLQDLSNLLLRQFRQGVQPHKSPIPVPSTRFPGVSWSSTRACWCHDIFSKPHEATGSEGC